MSVYKENCRFNFLIITHPEIKTIDDFLRIAVCENIKIIKRKDSNYCKTIGTLVPDKKVNVINGKNIEVQHLYYYRIADKPYHVEYDPDKHSSNYVVKKIPDKVRYNGCDYYKYNTYIIKYKENHNQFFLFGAPFASLIQDSINFSAKQSSSQNIYFHFLSLQNLCQYICEKAPDNIRLIKLRLKTEGKNYLDSIIFEGADVLKYNEINKYFNCNLSEQFFAVPSSAKILSCKNDHKVEIFISNNKRYFSYYLEKINDIYLLTDFIGTLFQDNLLEKSFFINYKAEERDLQERDL